MLRSVIFSSINSLRRCLRRIDVRTARRLAFQLSGWQGVCLAHCIAGEMSRKLDVWNGFRFAVLPSTCLGGSTAVFIK